MVTPTAERAGLAPAGLYVGHSTLAAHFRDGVTWGAFPAGSQGHFVRVRSLPEALTFWKRQAPRCSQFVVRF